MRRRISTRQKENKKIDAMVEKSAIQRYKDAIDKELVPVLWDALGNKNHKLVAAIMERRQELFGKAEDVD